MQFTDDLFCDSVLKYWDNRKWSQTNVWTFHYHNDFRTIFVKPTTCWFGPLQHTFCMFNVLQIKEDITLSAINLQIIFRINQWIIYSINFQIIVKKCPSYFFFWSSSDMKNCFFTSTKITDRKDKGKQRILTFKHLKTRLKKIICAAVLIKNV